MPSTAVSLTARPGLLFWPDKVNNLNSSKEDTSASDFGARFGNVDLGIPHTPKGSLFSNSFSFDTACKVPFLANKQIYSKVIEWFESWRPWQQRILLCGLTNRCSTNQLESLATTLEPIFHRDFVMTIKHRYPSASFKTISTVIAKNRVNNKKGNRNKKRSKNKLPKMKSSNKLTLKDTQINSQHTSEREHPPVEKLLPAVTKKSDYNLEDKNIYDDSNILTSTSKPIETGQVTKSLSLDDFASQIAEIVVKRSVAEADAVLSGEELSNVTDAIGNVWVSSSSEKMQSGSFVTDTYSDLKQNSNPPPTAYVSNYKPRTSKKSTLKKDQSVVSKSLPVEGMDMLKYGPVEWEELSTKHPTQHHNAWLRYNKMPSNPPSAMSLRASAEGHRHKSAFSKEIHQADFFKGDRFFHFGEYQAEMRTGVVRKPDLVEDIYVPIQKMYKSHKWFPETAREGIVFVKPTSAKLKLHFKEQINQIWEWMAVWEDHEKLQLLKEVLKLCNSGLINYLGQCIYQRLDDRHEINWLPDRLLLLIFSYLSPDEIDVASQVCRRWHYLTSIDELWMVKCHEYGEQNGLHKVTEKMLRNSMKKGEEVDWRVAFYELQEITEAAIRDAPPRELPVESVTPDGMVRMSSGKYVPAYNDNDTDTELSSFRSFESIEDDVDIYTPGLATKLVHESNKLKKSWRDMKSQQAEKRKIERREEKAKLRELKLLEQVDPTLAQERVISQVEETPSDENKNTSRMTLRRARNTRTQSRLSSGMSGETLLDEIDKAKAELEALKEETEGPPKTIAEWVARIAEGEDQIDISLDVRHEIKQAESLLTESTPSNILLRKSTSMDISIKRGKKDKAEKEEFISGVRCSKRLHGHMDSVITMASDKKRLLSGSLDRSIRIWDIRTGNTIHKLIGHKGAVTCFAFDNQVLYSGSWDCTVMVWDLVHFERIKVLTGHKGSVSCISQDNQLVISGSHDGTVRVWEKESLDCEKIIQIHRLHIMTMVYDGRLLYTGCSDGEIKVTNIQKAEVLQVFTGHSPQVHRIILQGDLLISTNPLGQVWFWHKDKGTAEAAIQAHSAPVNVVKFVKGRFYTASSDMTIKEWDLKSMTSLRSFVGHKGAVNDILFQNNKLVSCDSTGSVRTWDFSIQLMQLGATAGEDGAIDHNVVDEEDLLKGKIKL